MKKYLRGRGSGQVVLSFILTTHSIFFLVLTIPNSGKQFIIKSFSGPQQLGRSAPRKILLKEVAVAQGKKGNNTCRVSASVLRQKC